MPHAFNFLKVKVYLENENAPRLNTIKLSKFEMHFIYFYKLNSRMRFKLCFVSLKHPECPVLAWGISVAGL